MSSTWVMSWLAHQAANAVSLEVYQRWLAGVRSFAYWYSVSAASKRIAACLLPNYTLGCQKPGIYQGRQVRWSKVHCLTTWPRPIAMANLSATDICHVRTSVYRTAACARKNVPCANGILVRLVIF